jgi:hypothetical protein
MKFKSIVLELTRYLVKIIKFLSMSRIIGLIGFVSIYSLIRNAGATYSVYQIIFDLWFMHPLIVTTLMVFSSVVLMIYSDQKTPTRFFIITLPIQFYLWISFITLNNHLEHIGVTLEEVIFLIIIYRQLISMFINDFLINRSQARREKL